MKRDPGSTNNQLHEKRCQLKMTDILTFPGPPADQTKPHADDELQTVLAAWHTATDRLQKTHETLRHEVKRLTDELEIKNRELARKNRLADLGQMASHVAHEVRNSLVPLTLYLSLLRRHLTNDAKSLNVLDKVEAGFTALEAIVTDLLQFTSHRDPSWLDFDLDQMLHEVCDSMAPQLSAQGIYTEIDVPDHLSTRADRDMLRRAVLNMILNALDVMPDGGDLTVTACHSRLGLEIEVADTGPGVADLNGPRLFEPFYTTKSGGTGLGLTIVERIAAAHGGAVFACNCPQGGAAFTIQIPCHSMKVAA